MNHQDIADRLDAIDNEVTAARERASIKAQVERVSLRELCGGIGHVFTRSVFMLGGIRRCAVCGEHE